jgi:NADPH-dependent 2,4-dienoyl-CoA reductase/sulfur reductase-like enzyme
LKGHPERWTTSCLLVTFFEYCPIQRSKLIIAYERSQTIRGYLAAKILRDHVTEQFAERLRQYSHRQQGQEANAHIDAVDATSHIELPKFGGIPPPNRHNPQDQDDPPAGKAPDEENPPREEVPPDEGIKPAKVCIVGAGAAGIYMALMLTYLGIEFDLLEASDRIGGRVYTYDGFKQSDKPGEQYAHNYYDVGAMRIPMIGSNMAWVKQIV